MRNKLTGWRFIVGLALLALVPQASWAGGTCTTARFHDWKDLGCHMTPGMMGAPPSGANDSGGNRANCPTCPSPQGQPRWWVDDPYENLWLMDEPLSYMMSSGRPMTFRWLYKQRYALPLPDECPSYYQLGGGGARPSITTYAGMRSYGMTNAAWSHNWMMDLMIWDVQWEADPTIPKAHSVFQQGYEAFVFTPQGGIQYFYNTNGQPPQLMESQTRVQLSLFFGTNTYPKVVTPVADTNGIVWGLPATNGFRLTYPDGSQDVFGFGYYIAGTPGTDTSAHFFLTQRIDPAGRTNLLGYQLTTNFSPNVFRLRYVVDPDGRTNSFLYVTNSAKYPWQLAEVDDAFARKAQFAYGTSGITNGLLIGITDAGGNSNSFAYQGTNGWVTNLSTSYGNTAFSYYQFSDDSSFADRFTQRALLVSEPAGAHQLFYYNHTNSSLPDTATPPSVTGQSFDNGSSGSNHPQLGYRNTYHWDRRQYAALSATVRGYLTNSIPLGIQSLTVADYYKAHLQHWLWQADGVSISQSVSSECAPSQDAGGAVQGVRTWYNYPNKLVEATTEGDPQPSCIGRWMPDATTVQYTAYNYYVYPANLVGLVSDNEATYTKSDGTVGARTNWFGYSTNGIDLTSITNSFGQWVKLAYNAHHQANFITNALNQLTSLSWEDTFTHDLQSVSWPSGETLTLDYFPPAYGRFSFTNATTALLRSISLSPQGRTITNTDYTNGLPRAISATGTGLPTLLVTNTWDGLNRLTGRRFTDGTTISNIYDRMHLGAAKDRLGYWTYYGYDGLEHVTSVTNALSKVTTLGWCDCGALTSITDALTNTTAIFYNNQELLTNVVFADGSSLTNFYDSIGRVTSNVDGTNRAITYAYNNQGLVTAVNNSYGPLWQVAYDGLDRPQSVTDANNVTVSHTFDLINQVLTRTWPSGGGSEGYLWSTNGLLAYTNQDLQVTWFNRDSAGRVMAVTNARQEVIWLNYNALSQVSDLWDGKSNHTSWAFNQYGWLTGKTNALGHEVLRLTYDPNGQVTSRWTPQFTNTVYMFDPVGNLTNINYGSSTVSYAFDALNRLQTMVDASGTTTFGYTQVGQLQTETGPWLNDTLTYGYSQGHRSSANLNSQPSAFNLAYGYDSAWRLSSLASAAGTFSYGYGAQNSASPDVRTLGLPNFAWVTNHFDSLNRLDYTALVNYWGHVLDGYSYTYDAWGLRKNITRDAGLTTNTVSANYDRIAQLTNWTAIESGGTPRLNEQFGWSYDKAGNLNYSTNGGLVQTFNVDTLNQLSNITRTGNLTLSGATPAPATSVTVNGLAAQTYSDLTFARTNLSLANGQNTFSNVAQNIYGVKATNILTLTLSNTVVLLYDSNGNLTNDGIRSFLYDAENRLVTNWVVSAWKSEFVYDGLGRRRIERDYGWIGSWSKTNELHFIYDGWLLIQVRDANNNVLVSYTRGLDLSATLEEAGGIGGLLARTDGNGSTFYHADGAGNVTALMDGNQNIAARYLYAPFGRLTGKWGTMAEANVMQFSSMPVHRQSGLSLYPSRAYDPSLQRWTTRDPIGEVGGVNLYGFVGNSPANRTDPLGESDYNRPPGSVSGGAVSWLDGLFTPAPTTVLYGPPRPEPEIPHNQGDLLAGLNSLWNFLNPPLPPGTQVGVVSFGPFSLGGPGGNALGAARAARLARCNWRSVKQFGHTFTEHGSKRALQELADRARALGPQGRWVDNEEAAQFLSQFEGKLTGPTTVALPPGIGQIVNADGSVASAARATLVPSPTGLRTAYPIQ